MARFVPPITDMKPLGHLLFYKSGTNTVLVTYKDELETIANITEVAVNADGNVANVFFSSSAKVKFFDQFGVQYAERDPVGGEKELGNFTLWDEQVSYGKGDITKGSSGEFYKSLSDGNIQNNPTDTPGNNEFWECWPVNGIYNAKISYSQGEVAQSNIGNLWKSKVNANLNNNPETDSGDNWEIAVLIPPDLWVNKSSTFTLESNIKYQIDGSASSVDAAFKSSYTIGDSITVSNESISTNTVKLINTSLTIKGKGATAVAGDNIILPAGFVAIFIAKTTTILESLG